MNRPVRKARAIAISKVRDDHNKRRMGLIAGAVAASLVVYGLALVGLFG